MVFWMQEKEELPKRRKIVNDKKWAKIGKVLGESETKSDYTLDN